MVAWHRRSAVEAPRLVRSIRRRVQRMQVQLAVAGVFHLEEGAVCRAAKRLSSGGPDFRPSRLVESVSDQLTLERRHVHSRRAGQDAGPFRWDKDGVGGNVDFLLSSRRCLLLQAGLGYVVRRGSLLLSLGRRIRWRRRRRGRGLLWLCQRHDLQTGEGDLRDGKGGWQTELEQSVSPDGGRVRREDKLDGADLRLRFGELQRRAALELVVPGDFDRESFAGRISLRRSGCRLVVSIDVDRKLGAGLRRRRLCGSGHSLRLRFNRRRCLSLGCRAAGSTPRRAGDGRRFKSGGIVCCPLEGGGAEAVMSGCADGGQQEVRGKG